MDVKPEAYQLIHEGALALAVVEANGMKIDLPYLHKVREQTKEQIEELDCQLQKMDGWKTWTKRFGEKSNLGSRKQLAAVLFEDLELPCENFTEKGQPSTSEQDLEQIEHPFVRAYFRWTKLKKLYGTYLKGVLREVEDDGYLHPVFNLHLVSSYRSSSDSPNFQNIPVRNSEVAPIIRRAFVPRKGRFWLEIDFVAAEVRIAACYHQDPTMLQYIQEDHDLHTDMAAECFLLKKEEVNKKNRYVAKNGFVFPSFYGDYYVGIARNMWRMISTQKLTAGELPMKDHLSQKGIEDHAKFEAHIQRVESNFWGERFGHYNQWKRDWYAAYLKRLWFELKTGFVCRGVMRRNEVINLPVQGSAFHCLLWSLIELQKWLEKYHMKSLIIGQIHDSIVLDVHPSELEDVLATAHLLMTQRVRKHWPWIITPMAVEAEISSTNWWEKEPIQIGAAA